jgi:hypothetical protein
MYMTILLFTLKYNPWRGVHRKASVCYTAVYKTKLLLGSTHFMRERDLSEDKTTLLLGSTHFMRARDLSEDLK